VTLKKLASVIFTGYECLKHGRFETLRRLDLQDENKKKGGRIRKNRDWKSQGRQQHQSQTGEVNALLVGANSQKWNES
jgi:hypothetical protein